jgi:hypothetical protein
VFVEGIGVAVMIMYCGSAGNDDGGGVPHAENRNASEIKQDVISRR